MITPRELPVLDLAIVLIYLLGTTGFGIWFVRRTASLEDHIRGGRPLPWWALGLSILGTYLSSITFLAEPGKAYASDWRPFVFSLTLLPACWITARWFIPLYRGRIQTTAYEHLEQRFGYWARAYTGLSLILLQIGRVAVVLYLLALAVAGLVGWEIRWIIVGLGVLTLLYTTLGGFAAVVWTDVIQAVVLLVAALLCALLLWLNIPGGTATILEVAARDHKFALGSLDLNLVHQGFWVILLFGLAENLRNFGIDQNYVQRFLFAPSAQAAERSLWLGGLIYIPISALFFLIGTLLYVYYQTIPNSALPAKPDQVFPFFIMTEIPAGAVGLVIAGILAAGMSTLSSSLNSSATVWVMDFHTGLVPSAQGSGRLLWVTRLTTVAIGSLGTAASLAMLEVRTVLDVWWELSAVFGGGMLGLFLLGLVTRATGRAAGIATVLGILVIAWGTLGKHLGPGFQPLVLPVHPLLFGAMGTLTILVSGWLLSLWSHSGTAPPAAGPG